MRPAVLVLLSMACAPDAGPADPLAVDTLDGAAVCADLDDSRIGVRGTGLDPLMSDLLVAEPSFEIADVTLTRAGDLSGTPDGDTTRIELLAGDGQVVYDEGELQLRLAGIVLAQGTWDVEVVHPRGETALLQPGFVVVPPPVLTEVAPTQIGPVVESLWVTGEGFIDLRGSLPVVQIGNHVMRAVAVDQCTDLPVEGVRTCAEVEFEIDGAAIGPGIHPLLLANPAPAECRAETGVALQITST